MKHLADSPSTPDGLLLRATGLTVRFGGVVALDSADLEVREGTIHALIGPNGAGKSTCFNAITGLYPLAAGEVSLRDVRLDRLPRHRVVSAGVARTFQNLVLPASLTVRATMRSGRHHRTTSGLLSTALHLPSARREARRDDDMVRSVAEILGLTAYLDEPVAVLPYGLRKKTEIARALCAEPDLLLLDEPVAGMNDAETIAMGQRIKECRDAFKLTILLVEHHMELVMGISDHVTVLQSGRVIADGVPQEVQEDPRVIAAYLGSDDDLPVLSTEPGTAAAGPGHNEELVSRG